MLGTRRLEPTAGPFDCDVHLRPAVSPPVTTEVHPSANCVCDPRLRAFPILREPTKRQSKGAYSKSIERWKPAHLGQPGAFQETEPSASRFPRFGNCEKNRFAACGGGIHETTEFTEIGVLGLKA